MLPLWNGEGLASPKYGNIAIEKLIERMLYLGSRKANLQAKIFGGGEVIDVNISGRFVLVSGILLLPKSCWRSIGFLLWRKALVASVGVS